ncbi:hypothetical protein V6N13_094796 [Hibiscus sabdariffa]
MVTWFMNMMDKEWQKNEKRKMHKMVTYLSEYGIVEWLFHAVQCCLLITAHCPVQHTRGWRLYDDVSKGLDRQNVIFVVVLLPCNAYILLSRYLRKEEVIKVVANISEIVGACQLTGSDYERH